MEYLAFALLILGGILVTLGLFSGAIGTNKDKTRDITKDKNTGERTDLISPRSPLDILQRSSSIPITRMPSDQDIPDQSTQETEQNQDTVHISSPAFIQPKEDFPSTTPEQAPIGKSQAVRMPPVHTTGKNPVFFHRESSLYYDSHPHNEYKGTRNNYQVMETSGIRRFASGYFSYDGLSFFFEHSHGQESFPAENIEHVAVYPNCIALTFKNRSPVALFFMENTREIRRILDSFHAA